MPRFKMFYNLYDLEEEKELLTNVSAIEIEKLIGISRKRVSDYADNNRIFEKKYSISRCIPGDGIAPKKSNIGISVGKHEAPEQFCKQWEEVCKAAAMLKNGTGKLVYIKGKPSHVAPM